MNRCKLAKLAKIFSIATAALFGAVTPIVASTLSAAQQSLLNSWEDLIFRIEDSKCRVGIAAVKLSVSELVRSGENLVGEYKITVPLIESRNDYGRIILPLSFSVGELGASGGSLIGQAISNDPEKVPSQIICDIIPADNQAIRLAITTEERTLNFKSRYSMAKN